MALQVNRRPLPPPTTPPPGHKRTLSEGARPSTEQLTIQLETATRRCGAEESQSRIWQEMAQEYREELDEARTSAAMDAGVPELEEQLRKRDAEALRCKNQESFATRPHRFINS